MDTWQFYQNDRGDWCWKHVAENGPTVESTTCYASRTDCIADAMRNGYLARTTGVRRYGSGDAMPWRRVELFSRQ
jgi:uncharacterized protein YegP (UPF0339 family)